MRTTPIVSHCRMLRRVDVQPDHVGSLGLELRIIGGEIAFEAMRLDAMLGPDTSYRHVRDVTAQFCSELSRGPVRRAIGRLVLGRARENAGLDAIGHLVALAPCMASEQSSQTIGGEAFAPAIDIAVAAIELGADLGPGESIRKQQDQTGMSRRVGPTGPCTRSPLQFHDFRFGQIHRALQWRNGTSYLNVTVQ